MSEVVQQILEGSAVLNLAKKIVSEIKTAFGKISRTTGKLYEGSALKKICDRGSVFLDKDPHFEKSVFYRVMGCTGRVLRKIAKALNGFFRLQLENSLIWKCVRYIGRGFSEKPYIFIPATVVVFAGIAAATSVKWSFALLAVIVAAVLILKDYERSIYVLAFYVFIDYILRDMLKINLLASYWDELLLIVCFGLWVYKGILSADNAGPAESDGLKPGYKWTPIDAPMLFFFGIFALLFLINSPSMSIGLEGLRAIVQYAVWFFLAMQLFRSFTGTKRVLFILLLVGTLLGLHGIYQYIVAVPIPSNWVDIAEDPVRTRAFSIVKSPNILGSLMVLLGPLSLAFMANEKRTFWKMVYLGAFGAMSLCVLFTYSKMALFAYVAALGIYFLIKDKRLIIVLIAAVVGIYLFVPSVGSRISYLLSPEYIVSSLRGGRLVRWQTGLNMFMENFIFGVGLGHFGGAVAMNNNIPGTFYMDNYYLKTAVEGGILGLGAFLILVVNVMIWGMRTIYRLGRVQDRERFNFAVSIFSGLAGVLAHNLVENVFEVPMMNTYFWLLTAVLMYIWYEAGKGPIAGQGV